MTDLRTRRPPRPHRIIVRLLNNTVAAVLYILLLVLGTITAVVTAVIDVCSEDDAHSEERGG
jgi:hypothetical protein